MADKLLETLTRIGLRPGRGGEYIRMWCPFHPRPSGRTLWVSHETGHWGCFSERCPQHRGGGLRDLLVLRGVTPAVAASITRNLDLKTRDPGEHPLSLAELDEAGMITEAHLACWAVDWYLAAEICAAVLRVGHAEAGPVSTWAPGCPGTIGQVEHDCWEHLWYWLVTRGLSPTALDLLDVGFDDDHGLVVFPLRGADGGLRGVARRECAPGRDYYIVSCMWLPGEDEYEEARRRFGDRHNRVSRSDVLFGWSTFAERIADGAPVVVVEGYADAVRLAGFGYCAVAKMGAQLTRAQADLLITAPGPKILWPDDDRAGITGGQHDALALAAVPDVRIVTWFGGVKDAGDEHVSAGLAGRVVRSAVSPVEWLSGFPRRISRHLGIAC